MPPTPPQDPKDSENKNGIDLNKILLPKKEGAPSLDSAQRVNAGALLAQEQQAAANPIPQTPAPTPPTPPPAEKITTAASTPTPAPTTPAPAPKKEESAVHAIQTYRGDIEHAVQTKDVSVVSIAAAEAERHTTRAAQAGTPTPPVQETGGYSTTSKIAMIIGGVLLVGIGAFLAIAVYTWPTTIAITETPPAPFITMDETRLIEVPWGAVTHDNLMSTLVAAKDSTNLPLGLMSWLYVANPATTTSGVPVFIPAATVLQTLSVHVPDDLLRTLAPEYLLGVHSFDENQAFLILRADSYDVAYSAMLEWELSMKEDLEPLFMRTPRPRIPEDAVATTTASTTPQLLRTTFIDRIVENRDSRVVENEVGDILLLWTFLDRNTIVITTNEYTLREIISRAHTAPVIPIPQ